MKTIKEGSRGADVLHWQYFLIGQDLLHGKADGIFGPKTHKATQAFQQREGLASDGVVGNHTAGKAMLLGFTLLDDPFDDEYGPNWPPRPAFEPLVGNAGRASMWGSYSFEPDPQPDNREQIRILGNWEADNIVRVALPQLEAQLPQYKSARFHKKGAEQLRALFAAWEKADLTRLILSWGGAFVPRFQRGSRTALSNHAFGSAFDINMKWNGLGAMPALRGEDGSVRELVTLANEHGFFWGGHFRQRQDGMHFEIAKLL